MPDLTLHKHQPKAMRQRVYDHMLRTRSWKYKAFLRHLRIFKYLAMAPVRGDFLESYYVLMRYLDDVVDGDAPLPEGYGSETDYMLSKIRFSQEPHTPVDEVDFMMLHCFDLARRFGQDFSSETKDILGSLLFDARRRDQFKVFPHEELMHHFHVLDIRKRGTDGMDKSPDVVRRHGPSLRQISTGTKGRFFTPCCSGDDYHPKIGGKVRFSDSDVQFVE